MKIKFYFTIIFYAIFLNTTFASEIGDNVLELNGVIYEVPDVIDGCNIVVHQNGVPTIFTKSDTSGKYSLKLSLGNNYIIEFSYPGYTSKKIWVDAKNHELQNYTMHDVMIDLFQEIKKSQVDVSLLNEPIAKIQFNKATNNFEYDTEHNMHIQKKVQELWNIVYNERISRDESYKTEMVIADSNFHQKNYLSAKFGYLNALSYRPMAVEPKEKLKIIEDLLATPETKTEEPSSDFDIIQVFSEKVTDEILIMGRKKITVKKILNQEQKTDKYKMVETNYGTYYFKNNTSISPIAWELETSKQ